MEKKGQLENKSNLAFERYHRMSSNLTMKQASSMKKTFAEVRRHSGGDIVTARK